MQKGNRVLHKLIDTLVRSTLDILLDELFQLGAQFDLDGPSLPRRADIRTVESQFEMAARVEIVGG